MGHTMGYSQKNKKIKRICKYQNNEIKNKKRND